MRFVSGDSQKRLCFLGWGRGDWKWWSVFGPRLVPVQAPLSESLMPDWCGGDPHSRFHIGDRLAIDLAKAVGGAGLQNEHIACFDLPRRAAFDAMFGTRDMITNRISDRQIQQPASHQGAALR